MLIKICKICLCFPGEKENKRRSSIKKKNVKSGGIFFQLLKVKACEGVCAMHRQWSQRKTGDRGRTDLNSRGSP